MGEVIYMTLPAPKTSTFKVGRHSVTLTYFPDAEPHERWRWVISFVEVKQHFGYAPTIESGSRQARTRIRELEQFNKGHG